MTITYKQYLVEVQKTLDTLYDDPSEDIEEQCHEHLEQLKQRYAEYDKRSWKEFDNSGQSLFAFWLDDRLAGMA